MNTRFTSGEKIAVGEDGGRCARGRTVWGKGRDPEDHESRRRDDQQSACNPRVPKAQNKLLGASCLACSIFGAGTMIPGAKSCGSVGKLGDRADPEGATASNGDVLEMERTVETQREEAGGQGGERTREGGGKKKREYKVLPPGEKTAVVFPSEVEDEDKRDRSQKSNRKRGSGD